MKMFKMRNLIKCLVLLMVITACEEVIEIDLNSSDPVLVAEGLIEKDSVAWLKLSYTKDYFNVENSEEIHDAIVSISDKDGNSENLTHLGNGVYKGISISGEPGKEYTITFISDDINRSASSVLNDAVQIYSVEFEENDMPRPGEEDTYRTILKIRNNPDEDEYHLVKFWVNGIEDRDTYYLIRSEFYSAADTIEYKPMQLLVEKGNELKTVVYSIDENAYKFYTQLNNIKGNNMMQSSTPYNPKSNFGNDVMGYFAAWASAEFNATVD